MRRSRLVATVAAVVVCSAILTSQAPSGHALFEQALSQERVEGNLPEAIRLYERVVAEFASDRSLAARALVQIGLSYEKLGRDEAIRAYERLVRDFADQKDAVVQARARLAALVRTPPTSTLANTTLQQLPDVKAMTLAIASDGTKAIVWDFSTGQNLAVHDFSTRQARPLTDLDWRKGMVNFAVWSPDSRRVAYQQVLYGAGQDAVSELRVTTLDGRSSVVSRTDRAPDLQPAGWTPDGTTLIVVTSRPDRTWTVGTLPAAGGPFTPIRSLGWSYDARDGSPRVSPDGRFLAYLEGESGLRDVHVVSLDGRIGYRVTNDPGDDFAPIWSPDSRHLAFKSNRLGSVSMWTVEVEDGQPVGQPERLKEGMQSAALLDWTERGIFYVEATRTSDLFTVPMDPVEARAAASPRPIPYWRTGRNISPVWSPDGGTLAFVSSAAAEPNRRFVVVVPAAGGQAREFLIPTTSWLNERAPFDLRWFGDGRGLGLSGHDTRGAPAVFRLRLDRGEWDTIPLPEQEYQTRIEWNQDGSGFYFARMSVGQDAGGIFERDVDGGGERLVYRAPPPPSALNALQFSPDRKWLAFYQASVEADEHIVQIIIADVRTGDTRTLLVESVPAGSNEVVEVNILSWTPSGDLLVQRRSPGWTGRDASETLILPVNGGTPRPFTVPGIAPIAPGDTSTLIIAKWSPDGRTMVVGRRSRGGETFVLENPLAAGRAARVSR